MLTEVELIKQTEADIRQELSDLSDPIDQYTYLLHCAAGAAPYPKAQRTKDHLIRECQVKTWLYAGWENEKSFFFGDSESLIVKGALSLFEELFCGRTKEALAVYRCGLFADENFTQHFSREQLAGLSAIADSLQAAARGESR